MLRAKETINPLSPVCARIVIILNQDNAIGRGNHRRSVKIKMSYCPPACRQVKRRPQIDPNLLRTSPFLKDVPFSLKTKSVGNSGTTKFSV